MSRKIEIIKNCIAEVINFLILFAIGVIVEADFIKLVPDFGLLLAVGVVPVFYYGIREYCESFWLFLLLHLLPWGGFWLFGSAGVLEKVLLIFLLAVITLMSFSRKLKGLSAGMDAAHPVFAAGIFWGLYLVDGRFGNGDWGVFLLYVGTCFAAGYLLRYFFRQFLQYIDVNNRTTENIPVNHVFHSAMLLAGGFTAAAGGIMILGTDKRLLDRIGEGIRRVLFAILSFLFSLLPKGVPEEEPVIEEAAAGAEAGFAEMMEAGEPSILAKILEVVLEILVAGALIALALAAFVGIIRLIREVFSRDRKAFQGEKDFSEDQVEKLEPRDKKQKEKPEGSLWERMGKAMAPEERIRRIYRKTLEKELSIRKEEDKTGLTRGATPRECCAALFPEKGQQALEFAGLYEKARYSRGMCGAEDVKRARKLAEEFHR